MHDDTAAAATDAIWNRACANLGTGLGDRHLRALLLVHGMVMNGGPHHAADVCSAEQIAAAVEAADYFHLTSLAPLIGDLPAAKDDDAADERLSEAYNYLVPGDSTFFEAFANRYAASPEDFEKAETPR